MSPVSFACARANKLNRAKAIVFTLVRAFEFELAVKHEDIVSYSSIVQRPYVKSDMAAGSQLPIIIRALA